VRAHELLKLAGHTKEQINTWKSDNNWDWNKSRIRVRDTIPTTAMAHIFAHLCTSETAANDRYDKEHMEEETAEEITDDEHGQGLKNDAYGRLIRASTLLTKVINRWTTYPIPTTETWKATTAADADLKAIITALQQGRRLLQADLHEKSYCHEWAKGRLKEDQGVLFQLEAPRLSKIEQLCR
jgi:hypothetical protein